MLTMDKQEAADSPQLSDLATSNCDEINDLIRKGNTLIQIDAMCKDKKCPIQVELYNHLMPNFIKTFVSAVESKIKLKRFRLKEIDKLVLRLDDAEGPLLFCKQ